MLAPRGRAAVGGLLLVAGILALAGTIIWLRLALQAPQGEVPVVAPAATVPAAGPAVGTNAAVVSATPAVAAATAPESGAFRERLIRAAVAQQFSDPSLPPEAVTRLAAGEVTAVAQLLQSMSSAEAAVLESRLVALCDDAVRNDGDSTAVATLAGGTDPVSRQTNDSYRAQRDWQSRLRTGCATARFDTVGIRQRLATHAAAGHAASLWELALRAEGDERTRKTLSAALLGSAAAQLRLANGLGGGSSPTLAVRLSPNDRLAWLKSAAATSAPAQLQYARCLTSGCEGIPLEPDPATARTWYERAARSGSPAALAALASGSDGNAAVTVSDVERAAWSEVGEALAAGGCLGFDTGLYAGTLAAARSTAERSLRPGDRPDAAALARQLLASFPCKS